jgi:hypothetical protein
MGTITTGRESRCSFLYAISPGLHDLRLNLHFLKGGSFLYVATVLQPVSSGNTGGLPREDEISTKFRLVNLVSGMFLPVVLSALVGHGHS